MNALQYTRNVSCNILPTSHQLEVVTSSSANNQFEYPLLCRRHFWRASRVSNLSIQPWVKHNILIIWNYKHN